MGTVINPPAPLTAEHDVSLFSCGYTSLDDWLKRRALTNEGSGASRTYVITVQSRVIGYYALASGGVAAGDAPGKVKRNMPDPVPVMILGRLAIDLEWQYKGLGADLLREAVLRTTQAAAFAGIRALLVHAKDERAAHFYRRNGLLESPVRPLTFFLQIHPLPHV